MKRQLIRQSLVLSGSILFASSCLVIGMSASANSEEWKVRRSSEVRINVDTSVRLRDQFDATQFFGFNLNYFAFQRQLWDRKKNTVRPIVVDHLKEHFPGSRYRYPGGMVANGFDWQGSIGKYESRVSHRNLYGTEQARPAFGVDEYSNFLQQVGGSAWYVLNLVGTKAHRPWAKDDQRIVAARNGKLAQYLNRSRVFGDGAHIYQLGNELDRSKYEWSHDEYAERSRASMEAVTDVDNKARFIAFLREFKYRYRDKSRGKSHHADLMKDVLTALPEVTDYSLMQYYDGLRADGKNWDVRFWVLKTQESIGLYKDLRDGKSPNIWITEHARQASSNQAGRDDTRHVTSSLGGAISTADYLTAMMQIPPVKGLFWHALNAGPWQLFDATVEHKDLRARPIFWSQALLRQAVGNTVYSMVTHSPVKSGYKGGYDVRAVAFGHDNSPGQMNRLTLWVVNRAESEQPASFTISSLASKTATLAHGFVAGETGVNADDTSLEMVMETAPESREVKLNAAGQFQLVLPPSSVSTIDLRVSQ